MQAVWLIIALSILGKQAFGTCLSSKQTKRIDTDIDLPVLLKELDHIQAIVGRYDTFFFLMKQVCFASVFVILAAYLNKPFSGIGFVTTIPILFYVYEYFFRCFYWSEFIFRLVEIQDILNQRIKLNKLYALTSKHGRFCKAKHAFKVFDTLFYVLLAVLLSILTTLIDQRPWSFTLHRH